jgi:hypothetical protein
MAWDASKPAASAYLVSADMRSNWAAIADQALGRNLLGDPEFLIWGAGTSGNVPSWWNLSGQTSDGNIARQQSTTTITIPGSNNAVSLTYDSVLVLYQNVLSTGDMTTSIKKALDGQTISAGVWVNTASADCKLVMQGPSSNVLTSAIATGAWTWVTKSLTLASSTMVRVGMGVRVNASGATYVSSPALVLGPIPPDFHIPGAVVRGTIATTLSGDPVGLTTDADGAWNYSHNLPFLVERVDIRALTAVTTANLIIDARHDTGTSWVSMYSATSDTSKPQLSATSSVKANGSTPDGTYTYRCFEADNTGAAPANSTVNIVVQQVAGTGGKNPVVKLRALSFAPPLQGWRAVGNYK